MRQIPDQLKSRNLVPFKNGNGRYNIPGLVNQQEALTDRVDADLSPEEQGFIGHYLGYADSFLRSVEHIVPEPWEEAVAQNDAAQNGREEVTEQHAQAKRNPRSKASKAA